MSSQPNRLIRENSPYLRQHAFNPVDWYPWSDEAFARARELDRPIFLSIGYSTCHWCHVMAKESFMDQEVANLLNRAFISVKVDREERPDLDSIYMEVCQRMTGRGGWPLTVIMTPKRRPFFAATYIPRQSRYGIQGLLELLPAVESLWRTRRSDLLNTADQILSALSSRQRQESKEMGMEVLERAYLDLAARFDWQSGGFGGSPKFPSAHNLLFLLRWWDRSSQPDALEMVTITLQAMREGGIFDQVGGGFHRYSTDAGWNVPHFEKMLYDQALLSIAYLEAAAATGQPEYASVAAEIFRFVRRELRSAQGPFFSALDADSEGEEGRYYLWTSQQIRSALGDDAPLFYRVFSLESDLGDGTGRAVLRMRGTWDDLASSLGWDEGRLRERVDNWRQILWKVRESRVRPARDEKILTDGNGLMIAALARGSMILEGADAKLALADALSAADYLLSLSTLVHSTGSGGIAFLDDYAFLIWGLIELYWASFDDRYLRSAEGLAQKMLASLKDPDGGLFFSPDQPDLLVRQKEFHDGAIPSGNAVAAYDLLCLAHILGRPDLDERAQSIFRDASGQVSKSPAAFVGLLSALDFALGPAQQVAITGLPDEPGFRAIRQALFRAFLPRKAVVGAGSELADWTVGLKMLDGRATAYVCAGNTCSLPTTDPVHMMRLLGIPRDSSP
ncbi:MAG TPA: thioredoxin domain-containing protein [Methanotrichaceae archaeon]|nr:thioredoxin domain-containing protein [Methanotrichaceae archaeon]HQF16807.1 thioredoxin domain-containing protein [Methanotrichaceae archaeon]HQI90133.1 thioredoxin domain-containing protein [Methanotrichaceae archaeon]HQJ29145.1 thioredoxin domain-containing protein [Methanotrichaceae archaeon]